MGVLRKLAETIFGDSADDIISSIKSITGCKDEEQIVEPEPC